MYINQTIYFLSIFYNKNNLTITNKILQRFFFPVLSSSIYCKYHTTFSFLYYCFIICTCCFILQSTLKRLFFTVPVYINTFILFICHYVSKKTLFNHLFVSNPYLWFVIQPTINLLLFSYITLITYYFL